MCQIRTATILFFVFTFLSSSSSLHDYYVSSTEVVFVEDKQQLQVTTRVFIDDLEAYFNAQTEDKIQLQPDLEPRELTLNRFNICPYNHLTTR